MAPTEILIVGCGIAGPVLATWLLRSPIDFHITIVERARTTESFGQNIDIRGAGATVIRKMGLNKAVRAHLTNEEGVRFVDENDRIFAESAADKTGRVQTGTSDLEILRGRLASLCYERCASYSDEIEKSGRRGVEFIFGETVEDITQDGARVHVKLSKSGETRSLDLVIGADGILSTTRKLVFGHEGESERIHKTGMYAAFFSMPRGKTDSLWRRWFHAPSRRGVMIRPGESTDRSTALMTVMSDDARFSDAVALGRKSVEQQKALIEDTFRDAGWECPRLIREMHASDDFYYNMVAQIKMPRWTHGRVALLGDAGYCPSPISGMGTTLAITGAYNLAGALTLHPNDHVAAFAFYESKMRPTVERAQKLAPGFPRLFHPETSTGIVVFRFLVGWLSFVVGLFGGLFAAFGPSAASSVPVEDYGFVDLPEWIE